MALSKITTRALANDSVTADKVADNAITTDMVASGEIGVTDLADGAITNAKVSTTAAIAASKVDLSSIAGNVDLASGALQIGGNTVINSSRQAFFTAATGSSLKLERSDVGHGMTAIAETATFGHLTAEGGANGGLRITALADTASTSAFNVSAYAHTPSTDGNAAVIRLRGSKKNGTGEQAIADGEDLLSIGNVGTERIIVKGNGDFQVNGTTVINSSQVGFLNEKTRIGTGATYPTDNAQLYIQRSNNNPYIGFFSNDGSRNAYLQSVGSGAFYLNNAEGGGWAFNNSTSDVLSITNTGAILGTDKLQITPGGTNYTGSSNTFASGAAVEIYAETLNTSSLLIANNSGNAHTWFNYTNGNNYITGDASNNTGDTIFRTYTANPDNYSETVYFKANGSVGISIDNPDAKLHVVGNTKLGSASSASWTNSLNDAGGLDVFVGSGSHALTVWDDNLQARPRFIVERGGNVGINTDTPVTLENQTTLQVSGNIKLGSANAEGLISIGDVTSTSANVGIWRGNGDVYGSSGNSLGLGGYSGITITTGNSGLSSQSRRMIFRADGDIELMNFQSAAGGVDTNALYWKIQNSANTGQYARLGGIKAETVSAWGGKLKFYTKPANGTPNDTVTEQMVIDQAGRVTTPNVPAFLAFLSNGSVNTTQVLVFNNTYHNNGGHYSNSTGVFTAPVDGYYHFTVGAIAGGAPVDGTQRNGELQLQKNGSHYTRGHWNHSDRWENVSYTQVIYLSANDQARVYFVNSSNNNEVHGSSLYTHFGGHLIG